MQSRPCHALPPVRGTYAERAPLKDFVWFRAGGSAEILFRPADADPSSSDTRDLGCQVRVEVR